LSRTPEFYRRFVEGHRRSGLTVADYCRRHHVAPGTYRKYLRTPKPRRFEGTRTRPVPQPALARFLPLRTPSEAPSSGAFALETVLVDGAILRFSQLDEKALSALEKLLSRRP